ncbi:MAG: HlyD family efflux transporter periplasmic adaptor subunit [bacterium]|nr:HlyD family efflux transporter periplasmic adaptor subunit [bacterium]
MASLFSQNWYRVATLRPELRRHATIQRHVYRGRPWYVLNDVINQRVHRFTPSTHTVISLMDGTRSVEAIWEIATEHLGDDAPTQDELIQLLAQLHAADVLRTDVPPDALEILERHDSASKKKLRGKLMSPLAITIPLFDPDAVLQKMMPWVRPFMGRVGIALWLAAVVPAFVGAGVHWEELSGGAIDHLLAPTNLVLIWLLFPVIKILHELGHGIMARYFGGEVHDIGVMLLVLTPVPYVDASSASAFASTRQRALVASAGMIVEVFVAALAFYVWLAAEPGTVRTLAYNAMLIGGITTITFNANPLLRFDGYYILADLLEIPNLRQRSNQQIGYLTERWLLGHKDAEPPDAQGREPWILVTFGVAAFIYRVFVVGLILLFVFELSLVLGGLLLLISGVGWIGMPIFKGFRFLFRNPRLRRVRGRAVAGTAACATALALLLFAVPTPFRTVAEGVVWVPEQALVRVESSGFIEEILVEPGASVEAGTPVLRLRDPDLSAEVRTRAAELRALRVRAAEAQRESVARARALDDRVQLSARRLARAEEESEGLTLRAGRSGRLVLPNAEDLLGRFARRGDLLAYVVRPDGFEVRAVVSQDDVELVRDRLEEIRVRPAEQVGRVLPARLSRVVPSASAALPSPALGSEGGGSVAVDPREGNGTNAVQPHFQIELTLPEGAGALALGGRVYVRFDHGAASLADRAFRSLRQLFLARLEV